MNVDIGKDLVEEEKDRGAFIMTQSHEFITNLLSYLPAKCLCSCARVCKSWHKISQRLLRNRHGISWSCVNALEDSTCMLPSGDSQAHPMATFEIDLKACLKTMWGIPRHALIFTEFLSWKESASLNGSRSKSSSRGLRSLTDIVRSQLPEDCSLLNLHTPGTVGTKRNLEPLEESESEGGISCLLLSEMENVRIHQFSSTIDHSKELKKKNLRGLMTEICGGGVTDDVKCILLFGGMSPYYCQRTAEDLQKAFHQEIGRVPVIAGAMVRKVEITEPLSIGGLVFSGPNVQAASVLLDESVNTRGEIKEQLTLLKNLNLETGRRTIAFMFACIGRGLHHYYEENVESQVFHDCFPNTPLFGLFGNGEIGRQNLTLMGDYDTTTKTYRLPEVVHGYTTIIVLISIK